MCLPRGHPTVSFQGIFFLRKAFVLSIFQHIRSKALRFAVALIVG